MCLQLIIAIILVTAPAKRIDKNALFTVFIIPPWFRVLDNENMLLKRGFKTQLLRYLLMFYIFRTPLGVQAVCAGIPGGLAKSPPKKETAKSAKNRKKRGVDMS